MIGEVNRNTFSEEDKKAVNNFINKENKLSFYGKEQFQKEYEQDLAKYLNKEYCLLTNSGTNALFSAYFALNLSEGDEIIVQTQTFWASVMPLFLLNLKPILVDSEKETGNMDVKEIEKRITKKTRAIVVTYFPGFKTKINEIVKIAKKYKLKIVEDISLCIGAKINNEPLGSFGDIVCFSLGSTKLLSGGQGGAIVTNNREYYERAIMLGYFGERAMNEIMNPFYRKFCDVGFGHNNRMHVLGIAISKNKFHKIKTLISQRKKRFLILADYLSKLSFIIIPKKNKNFDEGSWHGFYARFDPKKCNIFIEDYVKKLNSRGVYIKKGLHYPLLHQTNFFQTKQDGIYGLTKNSNKEIYKDRQFPNSEEFIENLLSFPLFLDEPLTEIHQYCKRLLKISREFVKNET